MVNQVDQPEFRRLPRPHSQPCLAELPVELLFHITRYFLGVGRERDVSALARTSKRMHFVVNAELYRLVIKHRTFHIVHWAARKNKIAALRIALAHGADSNQLCTLGHNEIAPPRSYRPVGWGLDTERKLDWAIRKQMSLVLCPHNHLQNPTYVNWTNAWFSASNLSMVSSASLKSLWHHCHDNLLPLDVNYFAYDVIDYGSGPPALAYGSMIDGRDDARFDELSGPVHDSFSFPSNMSETYMDQRDVKIRFVRLFRFWTTPLHLAAQHDNPEVIQVLLANGANVNIAGKGVCVCRSTRLPSSRPGSPDGNRIVAYTPLHVAICNRNYSTARVLVAHGARLMARLFSGNDDRSWLHENALHTALSMRSNNKELYQNFIEFLLRNGYVARIEERNDEDLTPLLIACSVAEDLARDGVVKLLLRYGAEVDNQGPPPPQTVMLGSRPIDLGEKATPAVWAAWGGEFRLCKLLLEHGADINARSSGSLVTMLHAVCSKADHLHVTQDRIDLFDYVLANSSDENLNAFDVMGMTPLSILVKWNSREIFLPHVDEEGSRLFAMESRLFGRGADILAGIKEGKKTPFEYMIERTLNTYNYGHFRPSASQICNKVLATMRVSKINQRSCRPIAFLNRFWDYLESARHSPVVSNRCLTLEMAPSLVHALIKGGFSPAEVDSLGDTAMTSFLKYLIAHPHLLAPTDYRSYDWDRNYPSTFVRSIMAVLQEHGAAPHMRNQEGCTAFDYLKEITEYHGPDESRIMLARTMECLFGRGKYPTDHSQKPVKVASLRALVSRTLCYQSKWKQGV